MLDLIKKRIRLSVSLVGGAPAMAMTWPSVKQRLTRRQKRPEQWDFREYAGDGFGWFQSRRTGDWRLHKITVRNGSGHVKKLYDLE